MLPSCAHALLATRLTLRRIACLQNLCCCPQFNNSGVGEGGQALEACLTPDAQFVLSGNPDTSIRAWSVADGGEVWRFDGHPNVPACLKVRLL
jgi:hypothetical protein